MKKTMFLPWRRRAVALGLVAALSGGSAPVRAAAAGNGTFTKHCVSCHGPDGRANTPVGRKLGAKDLALSTLADGEIRKMILEGRRDEKGLPRMPAFKGRVPEMEVDALIDYVRGFRKP